MSDESHIRIIDLTKRFGDVTALDCVSFDIHRGEIHAVLGENGAGKTTLAKILVGLYAPDRGEVLVDGVASRFNGVRDALAHGVGMVFQRPSLIPSLTVAENLHLGNGSSFRVRPDRLSRQPSSPTFPLTVPLKTLVKDLSMGQRQQVEIFRVLLHDVDILLLDEPTAALSPQQAVVLFQELRRLRDEGKTIVVITHRLAEVMDHADRVTVLRKGRHVATLGRSALDARVLSRLMIGQDLSLAVSAGSARPTGNAVLAVRSLWTTGASASECPVQAVSFEVHAGEIVGVAGIAGNGQRDIVGALTGEIPTAPGTIQLLSEPYDFLAMRHRIAYLPEDALDEGLAGDLPLYLNLLLNDFRESPYSGRWGFVSFQDLLREARQRISALDIRPPAPHAKTRKLSGGNLRKAILARELASGPELVIAVNPTAGLDIRAANLVQRMLLEKARDGLAILLVSYDFDEILALCDRVLVLYRGKVQAVLQRGAFSAERLGSLMLGNGGAESPGEPAIKGAP